jgi:phospholipid N-methyltransferase
MNAQTDMGFATGEPDHGRLREHSADFTPRPVVDQFANLLLGILADVGGEEFTMLDPAAGSGVFGQSFRAVARRLAMKSSIHAYELREEEKPHLARHYDEVTIGDALTIDLERISQPDSDVWLSDLSYDLIVTNPPFHLWREYLTTFRRRLNANGVMAFLGLSTWGQRSKDGVSLFEDEVYRPHREYRITGTLGFRGPGVNPENGKKWGTDTRNYSWWLWKAESNDDEEGIWSCRNLPLLDGSDRRWTSKPGTD